MCGCGIQAPCFGGCSCGCSHHAPAHVRYLRDSRGYVGGPDPETHNANARPVAVIDPRDPQQVDRLFNMAFERGGGPTALRDALREFANPTPPEVLEHFITRADQSGLSTSFCGKVWRRSDDVTVVGRCEACEDGVKAGWSA